MKIALLGTFDVDNYGDCLFPYIIKKAFERLFIEKIELFLFSPTNRNSVMGGNRKIHNLGGTLGFLDHLSNFDMVILAGGDTVWSGEKKGTYSILNFHEMTAGMRLWIWPLLFQSAYSKPGIVLASGVGRLSAESLALLKKAHNLYTYFSVRDTTSASKINSTLTVDPDIAFSLPELYPIDELKNIAHEELPPSLEPGDYITCQISMSYLAHDELQDYINAIRDVAKKTGKKILLLPICLFLGDDSLLRRVHSVLRNSAVDAYYVNPINVESILAVLACSHGFIGTSLHGAITSFIYGNQTIAICGPVHSKHRGVFDVVFAGNLVIERFSDIPAAWDAYDKKEHLKKVMQATQLSSTCFASMVSSLPSTENKTFKIPESEISSIISKECGSYNTIEKIKIRTQKLIRSNDLAGHIYLVVRIFIKTFNVR